MGSRFSSNDDFNSVLATQRRASINFPSFDPPQNSSPTYSLTTIPSPVQISPPKNSSEIRTTTPTNDSSVVNKYIQSTQPLTQSNPSVPVEPINLSAVVNNQIQQESEEDRSYLPIKPLSISFTVQSDSATPQQTMSDDAVVLSRSIINPNDYRQTGNSFSSFQPYSTIVEHNGKQFLVEFKERTERRYIQYFDPTIQQMRYFEAIDHIPYRTIQPYKHDFQSSLRNNTFQNISTPAFRSNRRAILPSVLLNRTNQQPVSSQISGGEPNRRLHSQPNRRPPSATSPPSVPSNRLFPRTVRPSATDDRSDLVPSSNRIDNRRSISLHSTSISQSTRQTAADPSDHDSQYSQPRSLHTTARNPKNVPHRYPSKLSSFRAHTPTISDGSASSSTGDSIDSEGTTEADDLYTASQRLRSTRSANDYDLVYPAFSKSNETIDGYRSPIQVDPFARPINTGGRHHYRKLHNVQNYAEPVVNNRRLQKPSYSDYAPIPNAIKQRNYY